MTTTPTTRHWYAVEWAYGIGTYWQNDPLPYGAVRIFDAAIDRLRKANKHKEDDHDAD